MTQMSRLFESFEFLDRGWDIRVLENQSLRSIFVWLLISLFLLGAGITLSTYQLFRLHRFDWSNIATYLILGVIAFRYSRIIYRRLDR